MKQITFTVLLLVFSISAHCQYALNENNFNNSFGSKTFNLIERNQNIQLHNLRIDFQTQSYNLLANTNMLASPNTHDFEYFEMLYYKSKSNRNLGVMITLIGVGLSTMAYFTNNSNCEQNNVAGILLLSGGVAIDVGAFLWIYNGIKAHNNKNAMNSF